MTENRRKKGLDRFREVHPTAPDQFIEALKDVAPDMAD